MNKNYSHLEKYTSFILNGHLNALTLEAIKIAREFDLPILKLLSGLSEKELFEISKTGFAKDILIPISERNPFYKIIEGVARWKANNILIPKEQINIFDITGIYNIRKLAMIDLMRVYDYTKEEGIALNKEIENYFSQCINIGIKAYEEIQRTELIESQKILNGILENIPVIVSKVDKEGYMTQSLGAGLSALGVKNNELVGTNVFKYYPDAENTRRAINGEKIFFQGKAKSKTGQEIFYQSYFFPEENGALGFSIDITEQRTAEEKLQQQLRIFDTALSNTVDFNYIFDLEGRFIYVNKPLLTLWGKNKEEAVGKTFKELGYPDELVRLHDSQLKQVIESKQPVVGENSYTNPQGKTGYYQYTFVPVFGENRKIEAIVGTTHDITELKANAEKQYRSIFESSNDAILIYNYEGYLVEVNPHAYEMYGYTYEEMIGMHGREIIFEKDHERFLQDIDAIKAGKQFYAEGFHKKKDGSLLSIEVTGSGFYFKGSPHLLAIVRDITERKKAENALKESEDRFRTLADNIPNLAWIANAEGYIIWYNKRWYEYTGTIAKDMEGWGWQKVHDPKELPKVMEGWTTAIASGIPFEMVFPLKGADKIYRPFLTRVVPVKDEQGNIIKWFGTNTDITDQVKAEENLGRKNEELIKINNDLDNFIYTASHDLKSPVSNLEGLISLVNDEEEGLITEKGKIVMGMVEQSLSRLKTVIKELTEIARIQKDIDIDKEDIVLEDLFNEVLLSCDDEAKSYHGKLIRDFHKVTSIRFSKRNLRSILYNLLSNALKYTNKERAGVIKIQTYKQDQYTVLSVIDNGLGIPQDQKDKIFTMFKRFHIHVEGTGVGLYIVKRIIENSGGKIEVETEEEKGSTFKVFFKNSEN